MVCENRISNRKTTSAKVLGACLIFAISVAFTSPVLAQSKSDPLSQTPTTQGLNLNLSGMSGEGLNSQVNLAPLDLPASSVGSTLFKLDIADSACLSGESTCLRRSDQLDMGLSKSISSVSRKGIDFKLTPRASLRFDGGDSSALVGAAIEIGENLRTGSEFESNTWYFFAGADAEALTYSPNSVKRLTSGQFHLQDRIIVGDAQAGLGYRIGDADVSLSYLRREATAEDFTFKEDAAALSFTWKR